MGESYPFYKLKGRSSLLCYDKVEKHNLPSTKEPVYILKKNHYIMRGAQSLVQNMRLSREEP